MSLEPVAFMNDDALKEEENSIFARLDAEDDTADALQLCSWVRNKKDQQTEHTVEKLGAKITGSAKAVKNSLSSLISKGKTSEEDDIVRANRIQFTNIGPTGNTIPSSETNVVLSNPIQANDLIRIGNIPKKETNAIRVNPILSPSIGSTGNISKKDTENIRQKTILSTIIGNMSKKDIFCKNENTNTDELQRADLQNKEVNHEVRKMRDCSPERDEHSSPINVTEDKLDQCSDHREILAHNIKCFQPGYESDNDYEPCSKKNKRSLKRIRKSLSPNMPSVQQVHRNAICGHMPHFDDSFGMTDTWSHSSNEWEHNRHHQRQVSTGATAQAEHMRCRICEGDEDYSEAPKTWNGHQTQVENKIASNDYSERYSRQRTCKLCPPDDDEVTQTKSSPIDRIHQRYGDYGEFFSRSNSMKYGLNFRSNDRNQTSSGYRYRSPVDNDNRRPSPVDKVREKYRYYENHEQKINLPKYKIPVPGLDNSEQQTNQSKYKLYYPGYSTGGQQTNQPRYKLPVPGYESSEQQTNRPKYKLPVPGYNDYGQQPTLKPKYTIPGLENQQEQNDSTKSQPKYKIPIPDDHLSTSERHAKRRQAVYEKYSSNRSQHTSPKRRTGTDSWDSESNQEISKSEEKIKKHDDSKVKERMDTVREKYRSSAFENISKWMSGADKTPPKTRSSSTPNYKKQGTKSLGKKNTQGKDSRPSSPSPPNFHMRSADVVSQWV